MAGLPLGRHQHQALIGDLAFFPPNAAARYCAWRVSRRTDLGRATVRAWRLLSVAIWLYLLGDAIQLVYEVVLHQRPDPTWADAAYLAFYPVACAGFFAFPSRRRTRPERLRQHARRRHGVRRRGHVALVRGARPRGGVENPASTCPTW